MSHDAREEGHRMELYYRPSHNAIDERAARRPDTVNLSTHGFTPQSCTAAHRAPLAGRAPIGCGEAAG